MGRCLEVAGGVNSNRTSVQIFDCNGTRSQQWFVTSKKEIRNVMGRCLEVAGGVNANRTKAQIFDCNGTRSQQWVVTSKKEIRNVMGRCLEVAGGVNANRTKAQIFDCNGTNSQKWRLSDSVRISDTAHGEALDLLRDLLNTEVAKVGEVDTPPEAIDDSGRKAWAQVQKRSEVKEVHDRHLNLAELTPAGTVKRQAHLNDVPQLLAALALISRDSVRIRNDVNFDPSVDALKTYLNSSTQPNYDNFQGKFTELEAGGSGDWLAMLVEVFKESRRDTQENQKYFLKRLEERNKINDAIQEYLRDLEAAARKLHEKVRRANEDDKSQQYVLVETKDFDVGPQAQAIGRNGNLITSDAANSSKKQLGKCDLNNLIKDVDMMGTRSRNEADKIKGHFQAWTEKGNQVDQQLSAVLRTMKDVRRIGVGGSDLGAT